MRRPKETIIPPVLSQEYEMVNLERLQVHPRNVNQGDIGAIYESIAENGFYGACLVQRSTGYILAGKHRYLSAQGHGMAQVPVLWADVDDEHALRILLADNRTNRLGRDDDNLLAALLAELAESDKGLLGTGYDGDDLDRIIGDIADRPIGLDSTQYTQAQSDRPPSPSSPRDTGTNPDGSRYAICPECNHEFEVKPSRGSYGRRQTH